MISNVTVVASFLIQIIEIEEDDMVMYSSIFTNCVLCIHVFFVFTTFFLIRM